MRHDGTRRAEERKPVPYHPMTDEQVRAFLTALPARTGKLATVRKDGRPHVAPIWYEVDDDGAVLFNTGERTVKGRNLLREGRAALCVDDERPPFSFVTVEGAVEITATWPRSGMGGPLGARYMGAERAEEYGERNGVEGELLIRLRPDVIHSAADLAD
jgi:PPOX class probable F420-dependent enzyme